jgi:hypothetical protein
LNLKPCIYSFSTFKDNLPRTVGIGCLLKDTNHRLYDWRENQALTINKLFGYNENKYLAAAKGKVFFLKIDKDSGSINNSCFQVKDDVAKEVFCGNSTAASTAVISRFLHKQSEFKFKFICYGSCLEIKAKITPIEGMMNVSQIWETDINRATFQEVIIENRRGIRFDLFNDYLFLKGPVDNLEAIIKKHALNGNIDKKLAIIYAGDTLPQVQFYNCNGLHGAAPQTGLASLAILTTKIDWINELFPDRKLSTPSSIESLPNVTNFSENNYSIIMPDVDVRLTKIF